MNISFKLTSEDVELNTKFGKAASCEVYYEQTWLFTLKLINSFTARSQSKTSIFNIKQMLPDSQILIQLVEMQMPFGKYKGTLLCNLPVSYLEWFNRKGFPEGKLGMLLRTIHEIKLNGLEGLLDPIKRMNKTR